MWFVNGSAHDLDLGNGPSLNPSVTTMSDWAGRQPTQDLVERQAAGRLVEDGECQS